VLSIRFRLTLWYTAILVASLIFSAALESLSLSHILLADADVSLSLWADSAQKIVAREVEAGEVEYVKDAISEYADTLSNGIALRLQSADGAGVFDSAPPGHLDWPATRNADGRGQSSYITMRSRTVEWRVLSRQVTVEGLTYRLQIAASLNTANALARRFQIILFWTLPLVLGIASLGGYWISHRALAPVDAVTTAARAIGIGNLSQRLEVPRVKDELHRLSQTWNEMLDRLETAVARLSQFTADASHELRSPIALIRATAEITLSEDRTATQYRGALEKIMAASLRVSQLVEELLEVARSETNPWAVQFSRIDLRSIVEEVHARMLPAAEARRHSFLLRLPAEPAPIAGNESALRRLAIILADNAIKFTPPGGSIGLDVETAPAAAILRVRDNGIGISPDALPHIFERFFRADAARNLEEGAGLGLSIAQAIAKAHSAKIEVKSTRGTGSIFSVVFPT